MNKLISRLLVQLASVVETTSLVAAAASQDESDLIDQHDPRSPLGRNTHCAVVRRRMKEAPEGTDPGAYRVRGRYLLRPEALLEEVRRIGLVRQPPRLRKTRLEVDAAPDSYRAASAELDAKLRAVR